ncbi:hypothetical protein Apa02nite_077460 [Actinoplanes palleronii]|uniref:Uncharacterized protein n=1 Tax=Actinoplanes palleronii TaxID=113570 RepID=A0ABQ4BLU2_9ACTN|nr:hypothetical protein Apa02nite_077460 [Actinoplanes palleronii]
MRPPGSGSPLPPGPLREGTVEPEDHNPVTGGHRAGRPGRRAVAVAAAGADRDVAGVELMECAPVCVMTLLLGERWSPISGHLSPQG